MSQPESRNVSAGLYSTTLSEGFVYAVPYLKVNEPLKNVPKGTSLQLLRRALSTKSDISTLSSFAARTQRAAMAQKPGSSDLRIIGLGSCGSVFEVPGTELAFKKGTNAAGIWQDFCLTNEVHNANRDVRTLMQQLFPAATIPKTPLCYEFHLADEDDFWLGAPDSVGTSDRKEHSSGYLHRFPESHRTRQPLFTVDRILPLPQPVREALIDAFFDEEVQHEATSDPDNEDCLARVYLGERETPTDDYDTLRNFPLKLNMIEDIDVDIPELAVEMAIGLATIHWQAKVDGMDTEFVLGSSATWDTDRPRGYSDSSQPPHKVKFVDFKRRAIHLWMLDFDKASRIKLTEQDVKTKLVPAFLGNDPYYPRPDVDEDLWNDFRGAYLKASHAILQNQRVEKKVLALPKLFVEEVQSVIKENEDWNEEDNIVFG
ncbi:uncharacterized protein KY384_007504 [Bacidia gigantensis]|uniref:uncharacterized protein n=1 Tax=Bacidia gigantensis TaxID=2732470 RepID=UPI001D041EE2|nr:uncharacterized protein KY384_007504 [Bacidia gigantensis]KAG8527352.1 hypothetical protein KY384_007504 [Bacidia gigantensis]